MVAQFFATSMGRTLAAMLVVMLIQQFLAATLGNGGRLADALRQAAGQRAAVWTMAALLIGSYLLMSVLGYVNRVVQERTSRVLELGLMQRLVGHLMALSVPYVSRHSPGDLAQALRQDIMQVRFMMNACASMALEGMQVAGLTCVLFYLSPRLALWTLLVLPGASAPLIRVMTRRLRSVSLKVRKAGYTLFDLNLQLITGMRAIKSYRAEERELENTAEKAKTYLDGLLEVSRVQSMARCLMESLGGLNLMLVIVLGGTMAAAGSLTWAALVAFVMALRTMFGPILNIYNNYTDLHAYSASAQRLQEILDTQPAVRDWPGAAPLGPAPQRIKFEGVGFSYGDSPVLEGIDFEVRAGETIGIVGPSGAGKSTLLNLIVRFYDPVSGSVQFDGRDLRSIRLGDVADSVAMVTQDPFLFAATVRENIRSGRSGTTDAEVEEAARAASIHDEILALPNGYDTPIGLGGREISRGQAQRINIARALVKGAPLLLLDEATSSLDSASEAEVQKSIDRLMTGKTSFAVAHRLSTLRHADRLIVLEEGRCVGIGRHEELLVTCPLYRQLCGQQDLHK
jgi:subfamily B ATP-binding cassette protein MsbA